MGSRGQGAKGQLVWPALMLFMVADGAKLALGQTMPNNFVGVLAAPLPPKNNGRCGQGLRIGGRRVKGSESRCMPALLENAFRLLIASNWWPKGKTLNFKGKKKIIHGRGRKSVVRGWGDSSPSGVVGQSQPNVEALTLHYTAIAPFNPFEVLSQFLPFSSPFSVNNRWLQQC